MTMPAPELCMEADHISEFSMEDLTLSETTTEACYLAAIAHLGHD